MQARWRREQVRIEGDATEYVRSSDEGEERSFFFCPRCGATVYYQLEPKHIGVPVGAFADPTFPAPRISVWEDCMHPWVGLPDGIEHVGQKPRSSTRNSAGRRSFPVPDRRVD
jgi:hypothetical protein